MYTGLLCFEKNTKMKIIRTLSRSFENKFHIIVMMVMIRQSCTRSRSCGAVVVNHTLIIRLLRAIIQRKRLQRIGETNNKK